MPATAPAATRTLESGLTYFSSAEIDVVSYIVFINLYRGASGLQTSLY